MIITNPIFYRNLNELSAEFEILSKHKMLDKSFFDSWNHVKSPNAECHPRVLGAIVKIFSNNYEFYDINNTIYDKNFNWKPDLIFYNENGEIQLIFDYESPNSSDSRVIKKDFEKYKKFIEVKKKPTPYIGLTTLPSGSEVKSWKLRPKSDYSKDEDNHYKDKEIIKKDPRKYWLDLYKKWCNENRPEIIQNLYLFNITPSNIEVVIPIEKKNPNIKFSWLNP